MVERIGRQTPTQQVVLSYQETLGSEAADLYETSNKQAMEWQKLLLNHIMAKDTNGFWTHQKFGYEVPRQNGKGEVLVMREFWGLVNGENICHTAHKTSTSHSAWAKLVKTLTAAGYTELGRTKKGQKIPPKSFKTTKQYGLEQIFLTNGGSIVFRTRTEAGGIGESFDLLVIDEAQEYTTSQQAALNYTIAASKNPQTIFCGTPPTPTSHGTVFQNMRKTVLGGEGYASGWAEWSVYALPDDPKELDLWYETNPSLGIILKERVIRAENTDDTLDFTIQRLGYWYSYELKSEISQADWLALKVDKMPKLKSKLYCGVKFGSDGLNVSLSIAVKTIDTGVIFLETIDCNKQAQGFKWLIDFILKADVEAVIIDGKGKQDLLEDDLKQSVYKGRILKPTTAEAINAYASFRQAIDTELIKHNGQPSVTQAVANCEKRLIGTNGAFGFRSIKQEVDVSIVESLALAYWLCFTTKDKRKQRINY